MRVNWSGLPTSLSWCCVLKVVIRPDAQGDAAHVWRNPTAEPGTRPKSIEQMEKGGQICRCAVDLSKRGQPLACRIQRCRSGSTNQEKLSMYFLPAFFHFLDDLACHDHPEIFGRSGNFKAPSTIQPKLNFCIYRRHSQRANSSRWHPIPTPPPRTQIHSGHPTPATKGSGS